MSLFPWRSNRVTKKDKGFLGLGGFFQDLEQQINALKSYPSGLSVASDEKYIYVQADVPGLTAKEVEVVVDKEGILRITGERVIEEKERHYFRKSQNSFSYMIPIGEEIDPAVEPKAICKNGVMHITFARRKEKRITTKKISVEEEKG